MSIQSIVYLTRTQKNVNLLLSSTMRLLLFGLARAGGKRRKNIEIDPTIIGCVLSFIKSVKFVKIIFKAIIPSQLSQFNFHFKFNFFVVVAVRIRFSPILFYGWGCTWMVEVYDMDG